MKAILRRRICTCVVVLLCFAPYSKQSVSREIKYTCTIDRDTFVNSKPTFCLKVHDRCVKDEPPVEGVRFISESSNTNNDPVDVVVTLETDITIDTVMCCLASSCWDVDNIQVITDDTDAEATTTHSIADTTSDGTTHIPTTDQPDIKDTNDAVTIAIAIATPVVIVFIIIIIIVIIVVIVKIVKWKRRPMCTSSGGTPLPSSDQRGEPPTDDTLAVSVQNETHADDKPEMVTTSQPVGRLPPPSSLTRDNQQSTMPDESGDELRESCRKDVDTIEMEPLGDIKEVSQDLPRRVETDGSMQASDIGKQISTIVFKPSSGQLLNNATNDVDYYCDPEAKEPSRVFFMSSTENLLPTQ